MDLLGGHGWLGWAGCTDIDSGGLLASACSVEGKEDLRGARRVGGAVGSGCRGHDCYGKTTVTVQIIRLLEMLELACS